VNGYDELGFIERLRDILGGRDGIEGIGDDAAKLRGSDGDLVALDTMVEGVHFRTDWSSWFDIGWKLFATNASDLFVMGATPTAWLLSAAMSGCSRADADAFISGLAAAREALAPASSLIGGDTARGPGASVFSICMHGRCDGRLLCRSGAKVGDHLFVRGDLGVAAAGLALLEAGERVGSLVDAHRRPSPSAIASEDAERITAALDVSDGLALDAARLATASDVALVFDAPLPGAARLRERFPTDVAAQLQWHGGDDYAVLATAQQPLGGSWVRVGTVVAHEPEAFASRVFRCDATGGRIPVPARGYAHLLG
jgi:thiamine-monophosphate kinase